MLSRKRRAAFPSIDGGATGGPHGERSLCHGCAFSTASRWRAMRSFSGYFQGPCSFPTSIFSYERSAIVTAMIAGDASGCHVPDAKAVSRGSHLRSRIGLRTPPLALRCAPPLSPLLWSPLSSASCTCALPAIPLRNRQPAQRSEGRNAWSFAPSPTETMGVARKRPAPRLPLCPPPPQYHSEVRS